MTTLAQAIATRDVNASAPLVLGDLVGGDCLPGPVKVSGGTSTGVTSLRPVVGFEWDDATFVGPVVTTGSLCAILGGGAILRRPRISGGSCLGQLTIGIDNNRQRTGLSVPRGILVEDYEVLDNGFWSNPYGWVEPMFHNVYIQTTPGGYGQDITFRNGLIGPSPGGACMKIGGPGAANGVLVDGLDVIVGPQRRTDGQLPWSLLVSGPCTNIVIRHLDADGPSQIEINDGAKVIFEGCEPPTGTELLVKYGDRLRLGPFSWGLTQRVKRVPFGEALPGAAGVTYR